jgi:hypothetical protein
MTDLSDKAIADGAPSLCTRCSRTFQGSKHLGQMSILLPSPALSVIQPQRCRICSIIWSRHNHAVNRAKQIGSEGTTKEFQVEYFFLETYKDEGDSLREHSDDGPRQKSFELRLELCHPNSQREFITLAMVPADSKCSK